jgi:hypothetical protein
MASASQLLSRCYLECRFFEAASAEIGMAAAPAAEFEGPLVQKRGLEAILSLSRCGICHVSLMKKGLRNWAARGYKLRSSVTVTHHVLL